MANWRDRLNEAQFRGVPFYYEKVDGEIGRRTVLKEYPGRDKPHVEDLGLATRKFTIDMFFLGDNYDADRDAMREALETAGPGELIHPYWGTMEVTPFGSARFTESTKQGGLAKIAVTFVEAGDELDLVEKPATAQVTIATAEKLTDAVKSQFETVFSVADAIEQVVDDAVSMVEDVASSINTVRGKIAAALLVVDSAKAAITAVSSGAAALVLTPTLLANAVEGMVTAVVEGVTSIGDAFDTVAEFFDGEDSLPSEGNVIAAKARVDALLGCIIGMGAVTDALAPAAEGSAQQQEIKRTNQEAFVRLTKTLSVCSVSTAAVSLTYESYEQAQEVRESISDLIDDLLLDDELGDELYGPLVDLRASLADHFAETAATLPELSEIIPQESVPALVLAYQIYGDHMRETDILARNPHIRDQTAVPAGQVIKVLLDAA